MIFDQNKTINFIVLELTLTSIKFFIVQSIPELHNYNYFFNIIISLILLPYLILALVIAFKEEFIFSILTISVFIFILLLQILLFPDNIKSLYGYVDKIIGVSMVCLIISYSLKDYKNCYYKLVKASKIIIFFGIIEFISHTFFGVIGSDPLVDYDMSFGYFLVVPVVLNFIEFCSNQKKKNLFYFVIGLLMVVSMGSRGAILAIFVGCMLSLINNINLKKINNIFNYFIISILSIIIFINMKNISKYIYDFLMRFEIKSRFFLMLSQGNISSSTGRDVLQEKVFRIILEHPWIGIGMLKDTSSHNIFYEVMLFYGIPIGMFIIIMIVYYWLKIIFIKEQYKRNLMIIFLSYSVVDSLLNLTVLGKDIFWIYLGLAMSSNILKRRKVK